MADESTEPRGQRKTRVGHIVSDKMEKTRVVAITRRYMHPKYKKYVKERTRYKVHDAANESRIGDKVLIEETRPLSKEKRWKIKTILEKAPIV
jgi:small subunit ribosomal protein S17